MNQFISSNYSMIKQLYSFSTVTTYRGVFQRFLINPFGGAPQLGSLMNFLDGAPR